jgi:hypothetical protein
VPTELVVIRVVHIVTTLEIDLPAAMTASTSRNCVAMVTDVSVLRLRIPVALLLPPLPPAFYTSVLLFRKLPLSSPPLPPSLTILRQFPET